MIELKTSDIHLKPEPLVAYPPRQLLTPLPTPGHFLLVIDNSSLEVFTTCPKSAEYKLVRRREAHARNAALTFGGAIHEGLELFLQQQASDAAIGDHGQPAAQAAWIDRQNQAILRFFTENPAPPDEYRTVQNALAVLAAYRERAALPDYNWEIQSDVRGPIIERAFELPLGVLEVNALIDMPWLGPNPYLDGDLKTKRWVEQIHVAWSGRIDAVARCNNAIRVVDHKTTSIAGDAFTQDFQNSQAAQGYVWAAKQLWPELKINSFCVNAIHFKKPTGTGPLTAAGPRGGTAPLNFFRTYYDFSDKMLEAWSVNTLTIVSDFIHCLVRNFYPRHSKWCNGKFGRCQYYDVCWTTDDDSVRENMLASDMFKTVTWNPVAGR